MKYRQPDAFEVFNKFLDREMAERRKNEFKRMDDEKFKIPPKSRRKRRKLCFRQFFHL